MRVLAAGTVMVDVMAVGLAAVASPGEVIYTTVQSHIGGHPIDVAIDLVEIGWAPESIAVVTAVGSGPFGSFVRDVIDQYHFPTFLQSVEDEDTGRNLVLEVEGEDRRFHLDPGANWVLSAEHVVAALDAWQPDLFTLRPGYSGIDLALPDILGTLTTTTLLLDIMQPHPARPAGYLLPAFPHADLLHCNEREARVNTGASTLEEAVEVFLSAGVELVLVTDGDRGARAFTRSWEVDQQGFAVEAVDATGCGDAFCAGVIAYLDAQGAPEIADLGPDHLTELLLYGQALGASAATAVGCVAGVSAATTKGILTEQGDRVRHTTRTTEKKGKP